MHVSHTSSHSHVFLLLICHVFKTVRALAELDVLTPSLKEELTDWICKAILGWTLFCCCKAHFYFLLIEEDWGGCWTVFTFLSDLRGCSICTIWTGRESFLKISFLLSDLQMESGSCHDVQCPMRAEVPRLPFQAQGPNNHSPHAGMKAER